MNKPTTVLAVLAIATFVSCGCSTQDSLTPNDLAMESSTANDADSSDKLPSSPTQPDFAKFGNASVADVLQRLGARLELGSTAGDLENYSIHFDRTDSNGDGKHSREEFVEKGTYMTPVARDGIFRAADENVDGVVTRAEYVLNRIVTDEAKAIVQEMDDNEDGLVQKMEFVKHATVLLSTPELTNRVFAELDTNDDGEIPIPEYLQVWGRWARIGRKSADKRIAARRANLADSESNLAENSDRQPIGRPNGGPPSGRRNAGSGPPSVDEVFQRFDANKDGKLQKSEIPEFVQQFILPADTDGDELVTKDELRASRQRR